MDDKGSAREGKGPDMPAMRVRWGLRFSPHVLVFLLTLAAAIPPLRGTIVAGIHWWWDSSYAKVEYVMDEERPNDGAPYIAGHLAGSTEQRNLLAEMQGATIVVKALPQEAFAPGKRITIWHSPDAPNFVVFGDEVNDIPAAALLERPGIAALVAYLGWLLATFVVGFTLMTRVARRWSRDHGDLPMHRSARRKFT